MWREIDSGAALLYTCNGGVDLNNNYASTCLGSLRPDYVYMRFLQNTFRPTTAILCICFCVWKEYAKR